MAFPRDPSVGESLDDLHHWRRRISGEHSLRFSSLDAGEGGIRIGSRYFVGDKDGVLGLVVQSAQGWETLDGYSDRRLDDRAAPIEAKNVAQDGRLDGHDTTLTDHGGRIGTAEGRLDGHDTTLGQHASRIGSAETTIGQHGSRIGAAETTIGQHGTRLNDHASRIGSAENRLGAAESKNTQQDGRLNDHASRIGAAENDINDLATKDIRALEIEIAGLKSRVLQLEQGSGSNPNPY